MNIDVRIKFLLLCTLTLVLVNCGDDSASDTTHQDPDTINTDNGSNGTDETDGQDGTDSTDATDVTPQQALILGVEETESWTFPELSAPVQVLRTAGDIPHVYASNRKDLMYVLGFVTARHRFFMMDLARRLALGRTSELLGDASLDVDVNSRSQGMAHVAQRMSDHMSDEMKEHCDAFASGVNQYIKEAAAGKVPAPSELSLAQALLGTQDPNELMQPFSRKDVAAIATVLLYEFSQSGDEFGRTDAAKKLATLFEGEPNEELRRKGVIDDIWNQIAPVHNATSAAGWGLEQGDGAQKPGIPNAASPNSGKIPNVAHFPEGMLERLDRKHRAREKMLGKDRSAGFGSNAWAVSGQKSVSGAGLLAGDGHMGLEVPSLMYSLGLNTTVFGNGKIHMTGHTMPGLPTAGIGTNGHVAWSLTNLFGDVTDYFREEIILDKSGLPSHSRFQGKEEALVAVEETYEIADIPLLDSVGRTEKLKRWTTFDGRWLISIEGRTAKPDETLADGESLVNISGDWIVPGDTDNDGVITAVSMDYTMFDSTAFMDRIYAFSDAKDINEFRGLLKGMLGMGANWAAADKHGSILYSGYQATPCRDYLKRDDNGEWLSGANPTLILDGTQYGGFTIPTTDNGMVDEEPGKTDPQQCVVPFEKSPMALDPTRGYVFTANNDPGNIAIDNSLSNDPWFMGGPWDDGYRGDTISAKLKEVTESKSADVEQMATIQANHDSRLGELMLPWLLKSIASAKELSAQDGPKAPWAERLVSKYNANEALITAAEKRLQAWADAGYQASSGVKTFYETPTDQEVDNAVGTMIFNAWLSRATHAVFDDENIPGPAWQPGGDQGRLKALDRFLQGRGDTNAMNLSSWHTDTQESVFFDVQKTDDVERSDEILVQALVDTLVYLQSEPEEAGKGGFGTDDMNQWLWGLRHQAKFESLLLSYLPSDSDFGVFAEPFSITTKTLPLGDDFDGAYPKDQALKWFPRHGDLYNVDASNPGLSGTDFTYGSGPMMRMVVALKDGKVWGQSVLPGGQSAITDSEFFADQAALWLGNKTLPLLYHVEDVVNGAVGREVYAPK